MIDFVQGAEWRIHYIVKTVAISFMTWLISARLAVGSIFTWRTWTDRFIRNVCARNLWLGWRSSSWRTVLHSSSSGTMAITWALESAGIPLRWSFQTVVDWRKKGACCQSFLSYQARLTSANRGKVFSVRSVPVVASTPQCIMRRRKYFNFWWPNMASCKESRSCKNQEMWCGVVWCGVVWRSVSNVTNKMLVSIYNQSLCPLCYQHIPLSNDSALQMKKFKCFSKRRMRH